MKCYCGSACGRVILEVSVARDVEVNILLPSKLRFDRIRKNCGTRIDLKTKVVTSHSSKLQIVI